MIRHLGKFVLAFSALALLASPAWAQAQKGRGGFGMGMGGGAQILTATNVQKDLKLSDEQIGKIQDTLRDIREKHTDERAALKDASAEERQTKGAALSKAETDEVKKALSFSDEQSKRFDQIALQALGAMAFSTPAVQAKLNFTDDQKSKLREIAQAARQGGGGGGGGFANLKNASDEEKTAARKKAVEARQENLNKVLAVLTDDQKKEWKAMTGEAVEINYTFGRRPNN